MKTSPPATDAAAHYSHMTAAQVLEAVAAHLTRYAAEDAERAERRAALLAI